MSHDEQQELQFSLRHLFWCLTFICISCALVRVVGGFATGLMLGLMALRPILFLLRIENFLTAALVGAGAAGVIFLVLSSAFPSTPVWLLVMGWISYPVCGYVLGAFWSADAALQTDLSQDNWMPTRSR